MKRLEKASRILPAILVGFVILQLAAGQGPSPSGSTGAATAATPTNWLPKGIESLRHDAASKTEFTLDHSMLVFASKVDSDNEDLRRVIAGVNAISVHDLRYTGRWAYDADALSSIRDDYHAAGWTQLLNKHDKNGTEGVTDLWIKLENNAISNIAVLVAKASEIDYVVVSGSISPMDLARLGGHFGIPKIEGGVTIPNTQSH
jgi:hypothetical protein